MFPAVLVTGPRQSGKTTFLLNEIGQHYQYVTFDDPLEREFALSDPNHFLDRFSSDPVILDEIQYVPELLSYLKIRIDQNRQENGKWVLTGSQQFHLMRNVSESLAGRIAILELLPFCSLEIDADHLQDLEDYLWLGCYPEPSLNPKKRDLWVRSYILTYLERDLRQIQNIKDIRTFETFLGLCSANHSQILNMAALSKNCGISIPSVKSWVGILEASYICFLLPPFFKNYGKRLIKAPKLYFIDSSIPCVLTRQPDKFSTLSGAMGGAFFEGFIISEVIKIYKQAGIREDIFYWRSHDGLEVDMILLIKGETIPVEIKLTSTPSAGHCTPLNRFKKLTGEKEQKGILVCRVSKTKPLPLNNIAMPWTEFSRWLKYQLSVP